MVRDLQGLTPTASFFLFFFWCIVELVGWSGIHGGESSREMGKPQGAGACSNNKLLHSPHIRSALASEKLST